MYPARESLCHLRIQVAQVTHGRFPRTNWTRIKRFADVWWVTCDGVTVGLVPGVVAMNRESAWKLARRTRKLNPDSRVEIWAGYGFTKNRKSPRG